MRNLNIRTQEMCPATKQTSGLNYGAVVSTSDGKELGGRAGTQPPPPGQYLHETALQPQHKKSSEMEGV